MDHASGSNNSMEGQTPNDPLTKQPGTRMEAGEDSHPGQGSLSEPFDNEMSFVSRDKGEGSLKRDITAVDDDGLVKWSAKVAQIVGGSDAPTARLRQRVNQLEKALEMENVAAKELKLLRRKVQRDNKWHIAAGRDARKRIITAGRIISDGQIALENLTVERDEALKRQKLAEDTLQATHAEAAEAAKNTISDIEAKLAITTSERELALKSQEEAERALQASRDAHANAHQSAEKKILEISAQLATRTSEHEQALKNQQVAERALQDAHAAAAETAKNMISDIETKLATTTSEREQALKNKDEAERALQDEHAEAAEAAKNTISDIEAKLAITTSEREQALKSQEEAERALQASRDTQANAHQSAEKKISDIETKLAIATSEHAQALKNQEEAERALHDARMAHANAAQSAENKISEMRTLLEKAAPEEDIQSALRAKTVALTELHAEHDRLQARYNEDGGQFRRIHALQTLLETQQTTHATALADMQQLNQGLQAQVRGLDQNMATLEKERHERSAQINHLLEQLEFADQANQRATEDMDLDGETSPSNGAPAPASNVRTRLRLQQALDSNVLLTSQVGDLTQKVNALEGQLARISVLPRAANSALADGEGRSSASPRKRKKMAPAEEMSSILRGASLSSVRNCAAQLAASTSTALTVDVISKWTSPASSARSGISEPASSSPGRQYLRPPQNLKQSDKRDAKRDKDAMSNQERKFWADFYRDSTLKKLHYGVEFPSYDDAIDYEPSSSEAVEAFLNGECVPGNIIKLDYRENTTLSDPWNRACLEALVANVRDGATSQALMYDVPSDAVILEGVKQVITSHRQSYKRSRLQRLPDGCMETESEGAARMQSVRNQRAEQKNKRDRKGALYTRRFNTTIRVLDQQTHAGHTDACTRWRKLTCVVGGLDVEGMSSDEEESPGVFRVKVPSWRSDEATQWLEHIDKRDYLTHVKKGSSFRRRVRSAAGVTTPREPLKNLDPWLYEPSRLPEPLARYTTKTGPGGFGLNIGELNSIEGLPPSAMERERA